MAKTSETEPIVSAEVLVEVTAPSALPEGATFLAEYEGTKFTVTVPTGGVTAGQNFVAPFNPQESSSSWKDNWAACTRYGICHPSLINALCCPLILLAQVMTRLKLNWRGEPAPAGEWVKTFPIFVYITIGYFICSTIFSPVEYDDASFLYSFIGFAYGGFLCYMTYKVRKHVRERDNISETRCVGFEDLCCALCCGCCTTSQLARQTADYDEEDAHWFSTTGLAPSETILVV